MPLATTWLILLPVVLQTCHQAQTMDQQILWASLDALDDASILRLSAFFWQTSRCKLVDPFVRANSRDVLRPFDCCKTRWNAGRKPSDKQPQFPRHGLADGCDELVLNRCLCMLWKCLHGLIRASQSARQGIWRRPGPTCSQSLLFSRSFAWAAASISSTSPRLLFNKPDSSTTCSTLQRNVSASLFHPSTLHSVDVEHHDNLKYHSTSEAHPEILQNLEMCWP